MANEQTWSGYQHPLSSLGYDLLAHLVFAPVGGLAVLRKRALDTFAIRVGARVLELGCGTGSLTQELIERGARVTAVDRSQAMLRRARRRAPGADFELSEITAYQPKALYNHVLFAFVLHELDSHARHQALLLARDSLVGDGTVAISPWRAERQSRSFAGPFEGSPLRAPTRKAW